MSHRGLSVSFRKVATVAVGCLGVFHSVTASAQVLDTLSELLKGGQSQSTDELPAPPKNPLPTAVPTDSQVAEEAPASQRIYLGLEAEQAGEGIGVRVAVVTRESPAWKAGFKVDDRILGINGFAIGTMDHMVEQLAKAKPGQSVNFLVNRDGRNRELVAVLMNAEVAAAIQNRPNNSANAPAWFGITSSDLTASFREQFGITPFRGAAVTNVVSGSPAHQAGIRPGDAITEAAGRPIETAADLQRWVEQSKPGDQAQIVFFRGSSRQTGKIVLISDPQLQPPPQSQRPPALPFSGATVNRPKIQDPKSPQPIPASPIVAPDLNPPIELTSEDPTMPSSERERLLEMEVIELKRQLAEAQAKLAETKQQLDNILRALKD